MAQEPATDLACRLNQAQRELSEALERQAGTDEVLRVISNSPGELGPVFQTILANATSLCEAKFANLFLCEGDEFRVAAMHNAPTAYAEERLRQPLRQGLETALGRCARTGLALLFVAHAQTYSQNANTHRRSVPYRTRNFPRHPLTIFTKVVIVAEWYHQISA